MTLTEFLIARDAPECGCQTSGKIVRGMCQYHYDKWLRETPAEERPASPRATRDFWDYVEKSDGCWTWTGQTDPKGYGRWCGGGFKGLAHRYSLSLVKEESWDGALACHRCDNPPCVRPDHLYWGTVQDNARDYVERQGVHNKGVHKSHCPKGHPYDGDNLQIYGGKRFCRACGNERSRERMRRKRAEARESS